MPIIKQLRPCRIYIGQFSRSMLPSKIKVFEAIHRVTNELYYIRYVTPSSTATIYIQATPILPPRNPILSISLFLLRLSVRCIRPCRSRHLSLPLVSIRQQLLLVVQQLLPRLGSVLGIRRLDNGVDGARLLAEAAVDALRHVDVVAGRAARAILTLLGFDGDGLGGADLEDDSQYITSQLGGWGNIQPRTACTQYISPHHSGNVSGRALHGTSVRSVPSRKGSKSYICTPKHQHSLSRSISSTSAVPMATEGVQLTAV